MFVFGTSSAAFCRWRCGGTSCRSMCSSVRYCRNVLEHSLSITCSSGLRPALMSCSCNKVYARIISPSVLFFIVSQTTIQQTCFICRRYLNIKGNTTYAYTTFWCKSCHMPLCNIDRRCEPIGRRLVYEQEHSQSAHESKLCCRGQARSKWAGIIQSQDQIDLHPRWSSSSSRSRAHAHHC
jgi:hypothetical protein